MTIDVETLLRELQGAMSVRQLYAPDHPRVTALINHIVHMVDELTKDQPEIAVFSIDNRLVWNGTALRGGEALARPLFNALKAHGFHRLVIRQGLTADELVAFLSNLARTPSGASTPPALVSTLHVRLYSLDWEEPKPVVRSEVSNVECDMLVDLWHGVVDEQHLDVEGLEVISLAIERTLERNAASFIPLADLKAYDDYTVTHIVNVALLAMALAEAIGYPPRYVQELGIAALLHDVGKLRVPLEILNLPGRLTDEQRAIIRRHPDDGARILLATPGAPDLAVVVAYEHHLQFDGGGYPAVPKSWRINPASEITHVADVFDALRSDRPYRKGLSRDKIATIMTADAGTVFDPKVIDAFFDHVVPRTTQAAAA